MQSIRVNLPDEINTVLNSREFDDEAGVVIETVKFSKEVALVTFSIRFGDDVSQNTWQIVIDGLKEERIVQEWAENIEMYREHVLLLQHTDIHTELYLKGTTEHHNVLFTDIFKAIRKLSEDLSEVSKYLFTPEAIELLSSQSHGLFSRGPKTILKIYEQCLVKYGIKSIFIGAYEPSESDRSLKLLKIGSSYFIANAFRFEKI